jgi:hypothetical protein
MTNEELKTIGLTRKELSTKIQDVKKRMEAGTLTFLSEVMTPERQEGMLAVRSRSDNGLVDLESIDLKTALFIKSTSAMCEQLSQMKKEPACSKEVLNATEDEQGNDRKLHSVSFADLSEIHSMLSDVEVDRLKETPAFRSVDAGIVFTGFDTVEEEMSKIKELSSEGSPAALYVGETATLQEMNKHFKK